MKIFKKAFDFYIDGSIHVAFAVFCLVQISIISNHFVSMDYFPFCVFSGTILGYNFLKYFEVFRRGFLGFNRYYAFIIVSVLAGVGFLFSFYTLENRIQKLIFFSGLFVLMYPFLRRYGWLKLFWVSFVVTFITAYIPFQTIKWAPFELNIVLIQRFFILTSLLIPFEIMDSKTDEKILNTLPQIFGINSAKLFGILWVIPFILLEFLIQNPSYLVLPIGIITVLFIDFTDWKRNKYYTSFWVESVPILWWLMLVLFQ
jgi:hypothetical protein